MEEITLQPIGILRCQLSSRQETPKNFDESRHIGVLEIDPRYCEGLDGIVAGETIVVLFWFHQARRDILRLHPRGDRTRPKRGVFATRSPVRPNPIAISEVTVLAVDNSCVTVQGIDALDGTPVLDIKKKLGQTWSR